MKTTHKQDPLVSVIVPVYNVEQFFERCINSIINQTYRNLEIILVDDGSTDTSGSLCDSYKTADKRITIMHKKNGGLSSARNAGLDKMNGKYVMFIDSDDYIEPTAIELLMKNAKKTEADIVICDYYVSTKQGLIRNQYPQKAFTVSGDDKYKYIADENTYNNYGVVSTVQWNKLFSSTIFNKLRFEPGKMHEDEFIIAEELSRAKIISYYLKPLYYYVQNKDSITHNFSPNRFDAIDAISRRITFCKQKNLDEYIPFLRRLKIDALARISSNYLSCIKKNPEALTLYKRHCASCKSDAKELLKTKLKIKTKLKLLSFLHCRPVLFLFLKEKTKKQQQRRGY